MSDPYKILNVSPNASDEEIKAAYRALAKKYHPDNYANTPLDDLATEKMKEINEAYDAIQNERKAAKNRTSSYGNNYGGYQTQNTGDYSGAYRNYGYSARENYADVRNMINTGRVSDAEQILDGVPAANRDAEWHFLRGTVSYRKGWAEDAYQHFSYACRMEPNNLEYRNAMNSVLSQQRGNYGGYRTSDSRNDDCSGCDICSGLLAADCCCECLGGDLVPCC